MLLSELVVIVPHSIRVAETLDNGFSATLENTDIVVNDHILQAPVGFGSTPANARRMLCVQLSGSRIRVARQGGYNEFDLPFHILNDIDRT